MTDSINGQRLAFFENVRAADQQFEHNRTKLPSLAPVTPEVKSKKDNILKYRQYTYKTLSRHRTVLNLHVESRQKQLCQINPIIFRYLTEYQQNALIEELEEARNILDRALYMSTIEKKYDCIKELESDRQACQKYINLAKAVNSIEMPEQTPKLVVTDYSSKWYICQKYEAFKNDRVNYSIGALNEVNNLRLYWVWGNSLLDTLFTLFKDLGLISLDKFNKIEEGLNLPSPITRKLSWMLYFVRLSLRIYLCLSVLLPNVPEEQKGVSTFERFISTLDEQKYNLLNDFFWGSVNLACSAWLTYRKNTSLGYSGDLLTAGFLIMDWIFNFLVYIEEQKKHHQKCKSLEQDIDYLEKMLLNSGEKIRKKTLKLRLANAKQRLSNYQFEFSFANLELINNFVYSTLLMLSFPLLIGLLQVPFILPIATGIIIGGAISCFAVTVLYQTINNLIPILKARAQISRLQERYNKLLKLFQEETNANQQKILLIQLQDIEQEIDYLKRLVPFQISLLVRSLTIDSLFPVLVFVALLTVPIGTGICMISAAFAFSIASKWFINQFEPTKPDKFEVNDTQLSDRIHKRTQPSSQVTTKKTENSDHSCLKAEIR